MWIMTAAPSREFSIYDRDLDPNPANYTPLSPLTYLKRAARVYPTKAAIVHGDRVITYAEKLDRVRRFAGALAALGVGRGGTVAVLAPNIPALLEAHYAVPLAGGVLNALNTRLDAAGIAFILEHSETKALLVDREAAGGPRVVGGGAGGAGAGRTFNRCDRHRRPGGPRRPGVERRRV